ncbi:hypothetical protein KAI92_04420 [Candidatus Parcubacteria bacterium]|nr:hypothetical protein [Candidatus Parcubacteria bacterium]
MSKNKNINHKNKEERDKKFFMFFGVIFFMLLTTLIWFSSAKKAFFKANKVDNNSITRRFSDVVAEINESIENIKFEYESFQSKEPVVISDNILSNDENKQKIVNNLKQDILDKFNNSTSTLVLASSSDLSLASTSDECIASSTLNNNEFETEFISSSTETVKLISD